MQKAQSDMIIRLITEYPITIDRQKEFIMKCTMLFNRYNTFKVKRDFHATMLPYEIILTEDCTLMLLEHPKEAKFWFTNINE